MLRWVGTEKIIRNKEVHKIMPVKIGLIPLCHNQLSRADSAAYFQAFHFAPPLEGWL